MKLYKYRVWCNVDSKWEYVWLDEEQAEPSVCPFDTGHAIDTVKTSIVETNEDDAVVLKGVKIEDERMYSASNRVPPGYTLYVAGISDDFSTGDFGGGDKLKFNNTDVSRTFKLLSHFYAIGARAKWVDTSPDNYCEGVLYAPATTHAVVSAGADVLKVEIIPSSGLHMWVPVPSGAGDHTLDLTAKQPNTDVLKSVLVPIAGNVGYYDYDCELNVITRKEDGSGGYNLYDFPVNLHSFGRYIWASKGSGESALDVSELVGKKLFNFWEIKMDFKKDGGSVVSPEECRVVFIVATKKNI